MGQISDRLRISSTDRKLTHGAEMVGESMRGVLGTVLSQIALVGAQSLNLGSTHPSPTHANITTSLEQAKVPIFQPEGSQLPRKKTGTCSQGGRNSEIPHLETPVLVTGREDIPAARRLGSHPCPGVRHRERWTEQGRAPPKVSVALAWGGYHHVP